jgi:hypothetical protein
MPLPRKATLRGKRFRVCHPARMGDCSGLCDDSPDVRTIWIQREQGPRDFMETVIHEAAHATWPKLSEQAVTRGAKEIMDLLWRYGYRRESD